MAFWGKTIIAPKYFAVFKAGFLSALNLICQEFTKNCRFRVDMQVALKLMDAG